MHISELNFSRHFLIVAENQHFPHKALEAALIFAAGFEKEISILILEDEISKGFQSKLNEIKVTTPIHITATACEGKLRDLLDLSERTETPMIFFEISKKGVYSHAMTIFKALKELRIPFILLKEEMKKLDFSKIIVPVGYLVEEKEKAPYSSNLGRFLQSEILLLQAKDYGSKTPKNTAAISKLYDSFKLNYSIELAKKDSFKVEAEAIKKAKENNAGMVIISNSREYGLDDMVFGPKEYRIFKKSTVPLMCINPRKDLYVLCW